MHKAKRSALTGQHRSDRYHWPVRPVWSSQHTQLGGTGQTGALTGQVHSAHKATRVHAIWSKVTRPGLQAILDPLLHLANTTNTIQFMHHSLAIESLKYYNKVQTLSSTHTNVLKSTKIKF
jgi:hypothetical protein